METFVKNHDKGFTLIEVLIAVVVFSFGVVAMTTLQIELIEYNTKAGITTDITTAAGDTLERLLTLSYDHGDLDPGAVHVPSQDTDGIDNDSDGVIDNPGGETGGLTVWWTVTEDVIISRSKTINVTVSFPFKGKVETVTLCQLKTEGA